MGLLPASFKIDTKQTYTFEEVFDIVKRDAKLPSEPYIHKVLGLKGIYVPGTATHDISITVSKNKLTVSEAAKPSLNNILTDFVTDGWSTIVGSHITGIKDMVKAVAEEMTRLFGK